jgi:hypothetical protein
LRGQSAVNSSDKSNGFAPAIFRDQHRQGDTGRIGDDYPSVLRQMKANGSRYLLLKEYTGTGATREQFIKTFATADRAVIFLDECERRGRPRSSGDAPRVSDPFYHNHQNQPALVGLGVLKGQRKQRRAERKQYSPPGLNRQILLHHRQNWTMNRPPVAERPIALPPKREWN